MPKVKRNEYKQRGGYHVFNVRCGKAGGVWDAPPKESIIDFGADDKNEEEELTLLKNKFILDVDVLVTNSETTRKAMKSKKRGTNETPRPQNAFMIYQREMKKKLKLDPNYTGKVEAELSVEVGKLWNNEPEDTKDVYRTMSNIAKKKHKEKYGSYKYKPKKNKSKKLKKSPKITEADSAPTGTKPPDIPDEPENINNFSGFVPQIPTFPFYYAYYVR